MTLDDIAALEALHAQVAPGRWDVPPDLGYLATVENERGYIVADCAGWDGTKRREWRHESREEEARAALIAAAVNALPDLLALARRRLEFDSAAARYEAASKLAPREFDADDMRDMTAAECRRIAGNPPESTDGTERLLWRLACETCAERVEDMDVRVVSRLVLSDGAAP